MNIHSAIRSAIGSVNRDRTWSYFKSLGYKTNAEGVQVSIFEAPKDIRVQCQQASPNHTAISNHITTATINRKLWLFSAIPEPSRPMSLFRPLAKNGDYLCDEFGNFWKVVSIEEDFSYEGWVSVLASMTQDPPDALRSYANGNC